MTCSRVGLRRKDADHVHGQESFHLRRNISHKPTAISSHHFVSIVGYINITSDRRPSSFFLPFSYFRSLSLAPIQRIPTPLRIVLLELIPLPCLIHLLILFLVIILIHYLPHTRLLAASVYHASPAFLLL